ncbi:Syntaxin-71 [Camellia lanceoleosa]|uniref:Syntaxin-71 n=1 Tax=Camellia lanceoleosa TaxID=1840588 RepID=A0ACC0H7W7_9ERIC|nr:Syntaxin-71 [Camellia lanceoleosa]
MQLNSQNVMVERLGQLIYMHPFSHVDNAASDLKNTNVRLKDTVNQLRSSQNFCIDIILLCIIIGIAAYLYKNLED